MARNGCRAMGLYCRSMFDALFLTRYVLIDVD